MLRLDSVLLQCWSFQRLWLLLVELHSSLVRVPGGLFQSLRIRCWCTMHCPNPKMGCCPITEPQSQFTLQLLQLLLHLHAFFSMLHICPDPLFELAHCFLHARLCIALVELRSHFSLQLLLKLSHCLLSTCLGIALVELLPRHQ